MQRPEKPQNFQRNPFRSRIESIKAKCTVLVIQLFLPKCTQPHENGLYILPHINLYLSMRQGPHPYSPGQARTCFFEILHFQEFCLSRQRIFFQKIDKKSSKKICGSTPRPSFLWGCAPAKCLAAVVLDNQNRALRLKSTVKNSQKVRSETCLGLFPQKIISYRIFLL